MDSRLHGNDNISEEHLYRLQFRIFLNHGLSSHNPEVHGHPPHGIFSLHRLYLADSEGLVTHQMALCEEIRGLGLWVRGNCCGTQGGFGLWLSQLWLTVLLIPSIAASRAAPSTERRGIKKVPLRGPWGTHDTHIFHQLRRNLIQEA